jgi:hypothetical protein
MVMHLRAGLRTVLEFKSANVNIVRNSFVNIDIYEN